MVAGSTSPQMQRRPGSPTQRYDKHSYAGSSGKQPPTPSSTSGGGSPSKMIGQDSNSPDAHTSNKQRSKSSTPSPSGARKDASFIITENGLLMSRYVSPPLMTTHRPQQRSDNVASPQPARPSAADPWVTLRNAVNGKLSERDLEALSWATMSELLQHFRIDHPVDVARVQLTWRVRQEKLDRTVSDLLSDRRRTKSGTSKSPLTTSRNAPIIMAVTDLPPRSSSSASPRTPSRASPHHQELSSSPTPPKTGASVTTNWKAAVPRVDTGRRRPP